MRSSDCLFVQCLSEWGVVMVVSNSVSGEWGGVIVVSKRIEVNGEQ